MFQKNEKDKSTGKKNPKKKKANLFPLSRGESANRI